MVGVSGLNTNMLGNVSGGISKSSSIASKSVSTRESTASAAASKNQQDSLTILLSEVRLSMAQSLLDEDFSFSPLESLTTSLYDLQAANEARVSQANPGSILSSNSLDQALESLNPAKDLLNAMEQTNLAQRNPELLQSILQSLEPDYANTVPNSPGSLFDLLT